MLQAGLNELRGLRYELLTTSFNISLVQALTSTGRFAEGIALVDSTFQLVDTRGDFCYIPELLRVKASLLLSLPQPCYEEAEKCLIASIELSRRQSALAWELRTSIDWAKFLISQNQQERAVSALRSVINHFDVTIKTVDIRAAESLLESLAIFQNVPTSTILKH
jgi:predicted ATPase